MESQLEDVKYQSCRTGFMVMKGDSAWGKIYDNSYGWVRPTDAEVFRDLKSPEDATYQGDPNCRELRKGRVVRVRITKTVRLFKE